MNNASYYLFFSDINSTASLLSFLISLIALISAVLLIIFFRKENLAIKLTGSLMVLGLAFAANNWFVYSLAIFIIATLVTELDFLEKIAALLWNRDKYWTYRAEMASLSEINAKKAKEAKEAETRTPAEAGGVAGPTLGLLPTSDKQPSEKARFKDFIKKSISFEKAAINALIDKDFFFAVRTTLNFKLRSARYTHIFDAVIETENVDYLIEVKYSTRPHVLLNLLHQLRIGVVEYQNYLQERRISKKVIPIGIIPAEVNAPTLYKNQLVVLKYDEAKRHFMNINEFESAVARIFEN